MTYNLRSFENERSSHKIKTIYEIIKKKTIMII